MQYERKLEAWYLFQNADGVKNSKKKNEDCITNCNNKNADCVTNCNNTNADGITNCTNKNADDIANGQYNDKIRNESVNADCLLNLLEIVKYGNSLSFLQARKAVAVYFDKICLRLQEEIKSSVESKVDLKKQEKQIESVEQFLHKAAANFSKRITDRVFSKNLNITERKKNLINLLKRFLKFYLKETHLIKKSEFTTISDNQFISEETFERFLLASCECDLEELLINYTVHNKATGLFCGVKFFKKKSNDLFKSTNGSNGCLHFSSKLSELKRNDKVISNTQNSATNDNMTSIDKNEDTSIHYLENLTLKDGTKKVSCSDRNDICYNDLYYNDLVSSTNKSIPNSVTNENKNISNSENVKLDNCLVKSKLIKDNNVVFNPGRKKLVKKTSSSVLRKRLPSADSLQRFSFQRLSYSEKQRLCSTICIYAGTNEMFKLHQI